MNVVLADILEKDLPTLYKKINTFNIVRDCNRYKPITWDEHLNWFDEITKDEQYVLFGILNSDNNTLLGTCYLKDIDSKTETATLGIRVWTPNRGVGKHAIKLLLNYAKRELKLSRVNLTVFSTNPVAIHVYKRCGFKMDKIVEKDICINGRRLDILRMCLDLEDA